MEVVIYVLVHLWVCVYVGDGAVERLGENDSENRRQKMWERQSESKWNDQWLWYENVFIDVSKDSNVISPSKNI